MGLCSDFFYSDEDSETLYTRISLTDEQLSDARIEKDELIKFIKTELSSSLNIPVKHWLQGSYKNHTLIRPTRKKQEFDIDVALYILCHAEILKLSALKVKKLNRQNLGAYESSHSEVKLEETKTNCERLCYPASFHIDIPLYYYDSQTDLCKLATQNDEWVDSDPKAFQDWFDDSVSIYSKVELAQLRRIIKYLKTWTSLKEQVDKIKLPSIAITVLVVNYFVAYKSDDDSFIQTSIRVMDYITKNMILENPIYGDDLFSFSYEEYEAIKQRAYNLLALCNDISTSTDSLQQYVYWSSIFEHIFPPFSESNTEVLTSTNLPAITFPPKIRIRHLSKNNNLVSNEISYEINAFKDEKLYFSIENLTDYSLSSKVHWVVRNQNKQAILVNDLGHISIQNIREERYEECRYSGTHYMECMIFYGENLIGFSIVKVKITGIQRPLRNPPRKQYYKGKR